MLPAALPSWRLFLARSRAWMAIVILAPTAVGAAFTQPHLRFDGLAEFGVEFIAWLLFLAGASLRWWATLFIGGRKEQELVTAGPYSICRNPLYLGTFLMTLSVGMFLQSISLCAAMFLVSWAYLLITVPVEEHRLATLYGDRFRLYCESTPRFFPRFASFQSPGELTVRLEGLRAEARRMLQWMWIPAICYMIEHLRMLPWWPTPISLP